MNTKSITEREATVYLAAASSLVNSVVTSSDYQVLVVRFVHLHVLIDRLHSELGEFIDGSSVTDEMRSYVRDMTPFGSAFTHPYFTSTLLEPIARELYAALMSLTPVDVVLHHELFKLIDALYPFYCFDPALSDVAYDLIEYQDYWLTMPHAERAAYGTKLLARF